MQAVGTGLEVRRMAVRLDANDEGTCVTHDALCLQLPRDRVKGRPRRDDHRDRAASGAG